MVNEKILIKTNLLNQTYIRVVLCVVINYQNLTINKIYILHKITIIYRSEIIF